MNQLPMTPCLRLARGASRRLSLALLLCFATPSLPRAADLLVPSQYATIQAAIAAAAPGDTVQVTSGNYSETLDFLGKAIHVLHVQDGGLAIVTSPSGGSVVRFASGEGRDSILDGFVLEGGSPLAGGGVYIDSASPTLRRCRIEGNTAANGGGVRIVRFGIDPAHPLFEDCDFMANGATAGDGGAVAGSAVDATFVECRFSGNSSTGDGGALFFTGTGDILLERCILNGNESTGGSGGGLCSRLGSSVQLINCWVVENEALAGGGGGVYSQFGADNLYRGTTISANQATAGGGVFNISCDQVMESSILWANVATSGVGAQLAVAANPGAANHAVDHCDVQGGAAGVSVAGAGATLSYGVGNLDTDPLFRALPAPGYHLQAGSPCIDAGDPSYVPAPMELEIDGEARVHGTLDMGADEWGPLVARPNFVDYNVGGAVEFDLDAGPAQAGKDYVMVGGATGFMPGIVVNGVPVPIHYDFFSRFLLTGPGRLLTSGFIGTLDANGRASALITYLAQSSPLFIGVRFNFVFVVLDANQEVESASNATTVQYDVF